MFDLHPQLAADTLPLAELELCLVRLMNCREIPWLVLVPKRAGAREITDLSEDDQLLLMREIARVSRLLTSNFKPHKINIAALGNVVPQLHIHAIARFTHDGAWPKPVWGNIAMEPYTASELPIMVRKIAQFFQT